MKKTLLCLSLFAAAGVVRAAVFDDVAYWFRGCYNWALESKLYDTDEFVNALYLRSGGRAEDRRVTVYGERSRIKPNVQMDVVMPYARRVALNRSPVYLVQPSYTKPGDETVYGYSATFEMTNPFGFSNASSYTVVFRYKHESYTDVATKMATLCYAGFGHSGSSGFDLRISGDSDNQYVYCYLGGWGPLEFKNCQVEDSTRLSSGKWVDLALVRTPSGVTIYTCPEGGSLCSEFKSSALSSATRNDSFVLFGTCDRNNPRSNADDVPVTDSKINRCFRGWVDTYASWPRALTAEEIKEAFCGGLCKGDAICFGIRNDDSHEFTGTNTIYGTEVAETSADLHTDWRYLPPALNAGRTRATVKFGKMDPSWYEREMCFSLTATTASQLGAAVDVTLNGRTILEDAVVAPGGTITAPVYYSDVMKTENILTVSRTDSTGGDLAIDRLSIEKVDAVNPSATDLGKVQDDVWAGAYAWWTKPIDKDGDGMFKPDKKAFSNKLLANAAFADHATHVWNVDGANVAKVVKIPVVCPASGSTFASEPCLFFDVYQEISGGEKYKKTAEIDKWIFGATNSGNYAWMIRTKVEEVFDGQTELQLAGFGYGWSSNTGTGLGLACSGEDPENMALRLSYGTATETITYPQTLAEKNHLSVGKWIDLGVSVSNGTIRVYYCVEGGDGMIKIPAEFNGKGCGLPSESRFILGLLGTTAKYEKGTLDQAKAYFYQAAVWPFALNDEEMRLAFSYPKPNLAVLGIANGNDNEFSGAAPSTNYIQTARGDFDTFQPASILPGRPFAVSCTVSEQEAVRNQLFRLKTLGRNDDPLAKIAISINGVTVTNYPAGSDPVSVFSPDVHGVYEIGIHRNMLTSGDCDLTIEAIDGAVSIDALSFGNYGRSVKVRIGNGIVMIVR